MKVAVRPIGRERQPLVTFDGFASDPDGLRAAAIATPFAPAEHHYPGIRAHLPSTYFENRMPVIASAVRETFGHYEAVDVIDASFSIVTTAPEALSIRQRLPHCDAFAAQRIALIHYLSLEGGGGTSFFRHRSTGFETVDEARAPIYFSQLEAELRHGGVPPASYICGDTKLFERTTMADAHYNRALLYRSYLLHSGDIAPDAALSSDPATGRLTVTAFLSIH